MAAYVQLYDLVAGTQGLTWSRYVTPGEARRQFPTLSPAHDDGQTLKGTVRAARPPLLLVGNLTRGLCPWGRHGVYIIARVTAGTSAILEPNSNLRWHSLQLW